jgi:hypothetical protein
VSIRGQGKRNPAGGGRGSTGRPLMQMHNKNGIGWYIVPGGEVTEKVATELVERPDVQPSADGLFPGISQTFKMRSRCHD